MAAEFLSGPSPRLSLLPKRSSHPPIDVHTLSPDQLGGLFTLPNRDPLMLAIDLKTHRFLFGPDTIVPDDLLTSLCLYSFGQESFTRLAVHRPSGLATPVLQGQGNSALQHRLRSLLAECGCHLSLEFGISSETLAVWRHFVSARQASHRRSMCGWEG